MINARVVVNYTFTNFALIDLHLIGEDGAQFSIDGNNVEIFRDLYRAAARAIARESDFATDIFMYINRVKDVYEQINTKIFVVEQFVDYSDILDTFNDKLFHHKFNYNITLAHLTLFNIGNANDTDASVLKFSKIADKIENYLTYVDDFGIELISALALPQKITASTAYHEILRKLGLLNVLKTNNLTFLPPFLWLVNYGMSFRVEDKSEHTKIEDYVKQEIKNKTFWPIFITASLPAANTVFVTILLRLLYNDEEINKHYLTMLHQHIEDLKQSITSATLSTKLYTNAIYATSKTDIHSTDELFTRIQSLFTLRAVETVDSLVEKLVLKLLIFDRHATILSLDHLTSDEFDTIMTKGGLFLINVGNDGVEGFSFNLNEGLTQFEFNRLMIPDDMYNVALDLRKLLDNLEYYIDRIKRNEKYRHIIELIDYPTMYKRYKIPTNPLFMLVNVLWYKEVLIEKLRNITIYHTAGNFYDHEITWFHVSDYFEHAEILKLIIDKFPQYKQLFTQIYRYPIVHNVVSKYLYKRYHCIVITSDGAEYLGYYKEQ